MLGKLIQRVLILTRGEAISRKYECVRKGTILNFCSSNKTDKPEIAGQNLPSADGFTDVASNGSVNSRASSNDPSLDATSKCAESPKKERHPKNGDGDGSKLNNTKPKSLKAMIKSCQAKLKWGPDGRCINVFEVATDVDTLIAAYLNLKAKSKSSYLWDNSDDEDDKLMEGVDIERFKKLSKKLRSGTYKFQSAVQDSSSNSKTEKK